MGRSAKPGVERRREILRLLRSGTSVDTADLSERLGVSEMTIRRDLAELETRSMILRSYGGATLAKRVFLEFQFDQRHQGELAAKRAIGQYAAGLVKPNETILINSGTTTLEMARALARRGIPLTVATQSLAIGSELWKHEQVDVLMLGGELSEGSPDLTGPLCEHSLERLEADRAFLGCDGFDIDRGVFAAVPEAARVSSTMASRAKWLCVLADNRKVHQQALVRFATFDEVDLVVTDDKTPPDIVEGLRSKPCDVHLVTPGDNND